VKQSIFDIMHNFDAFFELMDELEGDVSDPKICAIVDGFIADLEKDLQNKADSYAYIITEMGAQSAAIGVEMVRLAKLKRTADAKAGRLKDILYLVMNRTSTAKIKTDLHQFTICKNGGLQPIEIVIPADQLPQAYQIQVVEADKKLIREALQQGAIIEGCKLQEVGSHLRIK
jgi:predicted oxidoreductase